MGAMNGTSPLKFVLLSGHDTTLIPFLAAIAPDAWDKEWPRYASLITIELLRVAGTNSSSTAGGSASASAAAPQEKEGGSDLDAGGDAGGGGDDGGGWGEYYFRFVYNGEVLKLEGCDQGEFGTTASKWWGRGEREWGGGRGVVACLVGGVAQPEGDSALIYGSERYELRPTNYKAFDVVCARSAYLYLRTYV